MQAGICGPELLVTVVGATAQRGFDASRAPLILGSADESIADGWNRVDEELGPQRPCQPVPPLGGSSCIEVTALSACETT